MAGIDVRRTGEDDERLRFEVRVTEAGSTSTHQVTLSRGDLEQLSRDGDSPGGFVERCFRFLLEREPKEAILSRFDVREIASYYPEFRERIAQAG